MNHRASSHRTSSRLGRWIDSLEPRRLFSVPVASGANFAAANDTYAITVNNGSGATIDAATPLTSAAWSIENTANDGVTTTGKTTFAPFHVTLHSGAASVLFFNWVNSGRTLTSVRVDSNDASGTARESWTLSSANVTSFTQSIGPDGVPQDDVQFVFTAITDTYNNYAPNGTALPATSFNFNLVNNTGSTTVSPIDNGYLATTSDVAQTVEFGAGQLPVGDASIGFVLPVIPGGGGGGVGKASGLGLTFSVTDGRDMVPLLSALGVTSRYNNMVYTARNPTTGQAAQRYRIGTAYIEKYSFSDNVFDNQPRVATVKVIGRQYQLTNYTYSGTNNAIQSSTQAGWDYVSNVQWQVTSNSANVATPVNETRNTTINSVDFRFQTPIPGLTLNAFTFDGFTSSGLTLTTPDGGTTWTVGNLAAQETADRMYAAKLLAGTYNNLPSTALATNGLLIGSAGKSWTLDRSSPTLVSSAFSNAGVTPTPFSFDFTLSESVSATATDGSVPILIRRVDTGALVTTAAAHVAADGVTLDATLGNTLADGRYRATLPAGGVRDAAGNLLASDLDLPFFVLAGDVNHDAKVDFSDLVILAQNYNQTGRSFAQGNVNYSADGKVDFNDLVILAQQYGKSLPAARLVAGTTSNGSDGSHRVSAISALEL